MLTIIICAAIVVALLVFAPSRTWPSWTERGRKDREAERQRREWTS